MLSIKLCGITTLRDATMCLDEGAEYLGLIFAPISPRRIDPAAARRIVRALPREARTVGVFLDQPIEDVRALMGDSGVRFAQLHGRETPSYAQRLGCPVIKVFDSFSKRSLSKLARYDAYAFMLDLPKMGTLTGGGGGGQIDAQFAVNAKVYGRVFLSGRLHPGNVAALIRQVRPYGVDCCTATERAPGKKDRSRVREFVQAVRESENGH